MARLGVVQRRELVDCSPAHRVDHAFAQTPMEVAHQLGVGLGQFAERTVEEFDAGRTAVGAVGLERGFEAQLGELGLERTQAAAGAGAGPRLGAPDPTGGGGVVGIGADPLGHRREQAGEESVGGRVESEAGSAGAQEVEVLGPADRPAVDRLDVDQADLAQALQVQAHGVGVDAEALCQLRRRERGGGAGELLVHRVAGLVAERLEHRQLMLGFTPVHVLDGTRHRAYFQDVACIYRYGRPHGDPNA